jgi:hypothetical protein
MAEVSMKNRPYRQDVPRWRFQLRRAEDQIARMKRKLAATDSPSQARDLTARLAQSEMDRANYRAALGLDDDAIVEQKEG